MRNATFLRISVSFGLLLIASAASGQSVVQTPPMTSRALTAALEGPPLSLDDAIQSALRSNADLAAARSQVEPLRAKPAQAKALAPPMLEAQIWQWPINTLNPANTDMYMFMASQDLPGRGKRDATEALATSEIRLAETALVPRERDIAAAVTRAYWDLLIARRAIAIHLASVDLLHQLTDVAQAKYAAGRISQQDVLKAIVETTKLHGDLIDLEQQAERSRVQLNGLMNRAVDAPIGPLTETGESRLVAAIEDVQTLASREQPDLRVGQAAIERARAQVTVARTSATPEWSVGAGYMLQPHQTDAWLARLSVSWPGAPWSRGTIDARSAEATASVSAAEADAAAAAVHVRMAVSDSYVRVKAAEERAALIRTTLVPQSRQALDVSRVAYETDRLDFLAVIENERSLLEAQLAYERALAEWRQAVTDLERAVGVALPPGMLQRVPSTGVNR
ncbi:MAG TPA: TolC family protein [Vicinamibacterales bacterium]|nr:TolC family protein [Vicinamibacterales bacterium]